MMGMVCGPDGCEVDVDAMAQVKAAREAGEAAARRKLDKWLHDLDPLDYDAPGTTAREQT